MLRRIYFDLALLVAMPIWTQTGTIGGLGGASLMQTPPPVSGQAYSTTVGAEARSNYLHAGFAVMTAYTDNVLLGTGTNPVGDMSYSVFPTIALDQTTSRLHQTLTYSPGFTFYQHTNSRNEADQNLALDFQYRLSPHVTASVQDEFRKSSNVFNQPYSFSGETISGSAQSPFVPVVAPIADQLSNSANAELTYQFDRNSMIGASGTFAILHYPDPNQVPGLSNSNTRGGAVFLAHRLSERKYIGISYQYSQIDGSPLSGQNGIASEIQTHTVLSFLTIYVTPNFSFSLSAGPQYFNVDQFPLAEMRSWSPAAIASMGWQGRRTSFAASYSHIVSGGGGLLGAFYSDSANASVGYQLARTWNMGASGGYANTQNVSSLSAQSNPGGNMASGTIAFRHPISERLNLEFGYTHLHQSYESIPVVSNAPDANREFISISYQLTRPLGR